MLMAYEHPIPDALVKWVSDTTLAERFLGTPRARWYRRLIPRRRR
jgi:hypothetical protein